MSSMGTKYKVEIKVTSKPKAEYETDEYFAYDLPVAPAVMVGEEILVEGTDVDPYVLETAICKQLDLPIPDRKKKGLLKKLFKS